MKYVTSVLVAAAALAMAAPAQALRSHSVARPTLRRIDHCFYAPAPAAWAPLWPRRSPHPVHTGFNDMHGDDPMYAHWAVDVQTNIAQAKVYAMTAGVIGDVVGGSDAHFQIGPFFYYHAISRFAAGTHVARGQWVGRLKAGVDHVHLAETEPGCGLLDARRPTGPLRDPMNTEHPTVENLRAYAANRAAYRIFPAWPSPDRSTPRSLGDLHGVVDLRAQIFDMPVRKTGDHPQQPLMVAAVRSWLAPLTKKWRRYGHAITALDGSRWISQTRAYYDVMAPGSIHIRSCFKNPARRCVNRYILHTAGRGLDTRRYPDRWYHYCISTLTIRNFRATRCWPVRIQNHPRISPIGAGVSDLFRESVLSGAVEGLDLTAFGGEIPGGISDYRGGGTLLSVWPVAGGTGSLGGQADRAERPRRPLALLLSPLMRRRVGLGVRRLRGSGV